MSISPYKYCIFPQSFMQLSQRDKIKVLQFNEPAPLQCTAWLLAAMQRKNTAIETFLYSPLILLKLTASHLGKECERLNDKAVVHPMLGGSYEKKKKLTKPWVFSYIWKKIPYMPARIHGLKHMTVHHPFWLQSASQPPSPDVRDDMQVSSWLYKVQFWGLGGRATHLLPMVISQTT